MVGALWTGISGLGGSQKGLDNESNNIANVNTIGFKASRVSFTDQMYQAKIGKGVTSFDVEKMFTQGNLKLTGVSYDVGLSGDGFFQVSNGRETFYTRAGNFRMGESGNLEDVGKNKVQGWPIGTITDDNIIATDPTARKFSNSYSKLLGNKIIRDSAQIDTITAKATDYNASAKSDAKSIYTGAGYKSATTKIADVEELVNEYNRLLTVHANANPKPPSSSSSVQTQYLDFDLDNAKLQEGDELYIKFENGTSISEKMKSNDTEVTIMQRFIDKISNATGLKAHYATANGDSTYKNPVIDDGGAIYIEGIVPGKEFNILAANWSRKGVAHNIALDQKVAPTVGTGMGAIESVEKALATAVSGKQEDVYTPNTIPLDGVRDFKYQVEIYDNEKKKNVKVPESGGVTITTPGTIDDVVTAINADVELQKHVKAYNINGNLIVKTLDSNNDVEFSGSLKSTTPISEEQTLKLNGAVDDDGDATAGETVAVHFLETDTDMIEGDDADTAAGKIVGNKAAIMLDWNALHGDREITDITRVGTVITIVYKSTEGDVANLNATASGGIQFSITSEQMKGNATGDIAKSVEYSGREGAAAEFLKITTSISQTASKGDLQLRLDSLNITDSAFGDYSVDETGLITMKQDGTLYAVGQMAVAKFTDNRGLDPMGDNLYQATNRSGTALFNINNDKTADIKGGTLELSTADLSESLVNLMVFQRAFEANAKSITTADQILTTLIQLKR